MNHRSMYKKKHRKIQQYKTALMVIEAIFVNDLRLVETKLTKEQIKELKEVAGIRNDM